MKIVFLQTAEEEFVEAVEFYDGQRAGLGSAFASEVKSAVRRIVEYPEVWPPLSKRTRRCRTDRFPYGIVDQVRGDAILVVAVFHTAHHPDSWKRRLGKEP